MFSVYAVEFSRVGEVNEMSDVMYFCDCEPDIDFKDENQWREHMINVHDWISEQFDSISKELQELD